MKNLLLLLTVLILIFSCKKDVDTQDRELNHDTFGMTSFVESNRNLERRAAPRRVFEKKGNRKPKPTDSLTVIPEVVIFLDFDGGVVAGTAWNSNGDIVYGHSDLTIEEQSKILDSIGYDYSPFRVLVTTDENIYKAAKYRQIIIFSISWEWYNKPAGGVAYTNSYSWNNDTPCWVFTSLLKFNTKHIHEAGSHELGHTFGLKHQVTCSEDFVITSPYNYGTAELAPIMGVAYYAQRGEWWIGPNSYGCKSTQNDKQILGSRLGFR